MAATALTDTMVATTDHSITMRAVVVQVMVERMVRAAALQEGVERLRPIHDARG